MRFFLRSQDNYIWNIIQNGYSEPTKRVDDVDEPKPRAKWGVEEIRCCDANAKGLNALVNAISTDEFRHIEHCEYLKEAWDKLRDIHEGDTHVRDSKL